MREIRQSGSEGGVGSIPNPYPYPGGGQKRNDGAMVSGGAGGIINASMVCSCKGNWNQGYVDTVRSN